MKQALKRDQKQPSAFLSSWVANSKSIVSLLFYPNPMACCFPTQIVYKGERDSLCEKEGGGG